MRIEQKFTDMRKAFRTFDILKRGEIGFPEFLEALDDLGFRVSESVSR